jgi:hypothetical protein
MHLFVLEGMSEFLGVLLGLPIVDLLLPFDGLVKLFILLCTLDTEVLLSLVLVQLIIVYPDSLCLVFLIISLRDLADFSLRNRVFLSLQHFL